MEFTFYGAGCVLLATKQLKILIDPPEDSYGLKLPELKPDVTLKTVQAADSLNRQNGFTIAGPGEYELKGIVIQGIAAQLHIDDPKDAWRGVMYTVEYENLRVLISGNIAPSLKDDQTEQIGEVHLMVVPVGGHGLTLDASAAAKLVSQFEPRWVIPVHYDDGHTKYEMPQDKVDQFLHEVGAEVSAPAPKLKISSNDLAEETSVVVLEVQTK